MADHGTEQRIRARAFEFWLEEGRPDGKDREHWERAEREILGPSIQPRPEGEEGEDIRPGQPIGEVMFAAVRDDDKTS